MTKLGDVCLKITDGSHNPPLGINQSDYLMISSKNIDDDFITFDNPRYLSLQDYLIENKRTSITPDDLLMTIVGTIGRVAVVPQGVSKLCVQRSVAVIKPDSSKICSRFLMYQIQALRGFLEKESHGVAQKGLYLKQVEQISISLPKMSKQLAICQTLDKVSDLIAMRKRQLEKLDELVKARFVEMFGTAQNNVFDFPRASLYDVATDFFAGGDKPADCSSVQDSDHPFPVYANGYDNEGLQGYSQSCRVKVPAVTVSARGTVGCCFVRNPNFTPIVRLITIVPNVEITVEYLKHAIDAMKIKGTGTSQAQLTVPDFKKRMIIVPPVERQTMFSEFVAQVDKSKATVQCGLDKLETLKSALMQEYFG